MCKYWPCLKVVTDQTFSRVFFNFALKQRRASWLCKMEFLYLDNCNNNSHEYCWFSHDVTKIQTKKLSILPIFYFHGTLEQLKTNFHTNFRFKRVIGFVIEYAWFSNLLRDAAFTWRPRELSCRLKTWLISGNFAI